MRSRDTTGLCVACVLFAGCALERLHDEFYWTEASTETTTAGASSSSGAGSSSGSTGGAASTTGASGEADESTEEAGTSGGSSTSEPGETSGTGSSSGAPAAVCGDGEVGEGEECDDGNSDDLDACDNSCAAARVIFVTSVLYQGDFNGLVGADNRCVNRALNANLPQALKFRALLSDSATDAAERQHHARGWYRLVNGLPVAHGWEALLTGPLANPVSTTEYSELADVGVWTGSLPDATAVPGAEHCAGWTSFSGEGHWGRSGAIDSTWLHWENLDTNPQSCGGLSALYCVEQP